MKLSALGSGSSGNCFYVENKDSAILVDAGLSARQTLERLNLINGDINKVKGIFVTHEHADHTKGSDVLARHFNIPIFATKKTIHDYLLCSNGELISSIKNNELLKIAGMNIEAFSKSHKAADPIAFNITNGKTLSIITDAGFACDNIIDAVSNSDFLCIESNHDEKMLENGPYPYFLKQWIRSDIGHLSNKQAALCVLEHARPRLKNIVLSHLSQNNNTPQHAMKTFSKLIKERSDLKPNISLSNQDFPTALFKI